MKLRNYNTKRMFKLKDTLFIYFFYMDDKVSTKFDMTITRLQPTTWGIVAYIDIYIYGF